VVFGPQPRQVPVCSGTRTLAGQLCRALLVACVLTASCPLAPAVGQALPPADTFPGGFIEQATSTEVRPLLSASDLQLLLPATRGPFVFPAPYSTQGIRLTDASDCVGSTDCVNHAGYSYWRRINNHVGSGTMLIVLGLARARGGAGPTLFQYHKGTDAVTNLGPLFDSANPLSWATGEMWYFSATQATKLYVNDGPRLLRYDVLAKTVETVLDVSTQPVPIGPDTIIWQMHSSHDDRVHSATLLDGATRAERGCLAYREDTKQFFYFPHRGFGYDECQIDKSGRWLLIKEKLSASTADADNRIIDLTTGVETDLLDQQGAGGHSDHGFGYMVAADDWHALPNAIRLWKFGTSPPGPGTVVYAGPPGFPQSAQHVSHANASTALPPEQQYVCGSGADSTNGPRVNEVVCFLLDGSLHVLVVAPVMTDMTAPGGGDAYAKLPMGNLDVTGQYFLWTSNVGASRLDAFLVKVPAHVLTNLRDTTPPTGSITAPVSGSTVSRRIPVSATATDNVNVGGVQFLLDGVPLGAEIMSAPYTLSWDTTTASNGMHTLTAVVRDTSGNTATAAAISVTVANDLTPPTVSFTSPLSGATVSGTITVSANASDNVGVAGVQFQLDGLNLGTEVKTPPYTIQWDTRSASNGSHILRAVARDAAGSSTVSSPINGTVSNGIPTFGQVTLVWDPNTETDLAGYKLYYGTSSGSYQGSVVVGNRTSTTLSGLLEGQIYYFAATAYDFSGNESGFSNEVSTAIADVTPPVISAVAASNVTSSAATIGWSTDELSDSQVEYGVTTSYGSVTALTTGLVTAHAQTLSGLAESTVYHYRVKSKDAAGNLATSADFTFTTLDGAAPTVSLTAPAAEAIVSGTITVSASATDNAGVAGVQFMLDGVTLGAEVASAPYTLSWDTASVSNGTHTLAAVARDAFGNTAIASAVTVTVKNRAVE
jgi:hypothetical protein